MADSDSSVDADRASLRPHSIEVAFTVSDLPRSVDWYHRALGFETDRQHHREGNLVAVSLKAGGVRILLVQDSGAKGWERIKGEGFSVQFTTRQNIDQLAQRARGSGVALETEPFDGPAGQRAFRLRDPDGFRLTVSSEVRSSGGPHE